MMQNLSAMFALVLRPETRTRTARTVEVFGWLLLFESAVFLVFPHFVTSLLHLPELAGPGVHYFRLVGLLVGGLGLLYTVSGRLNAEGFAFASLLDRPLVPLVMAILWLLDAIPGSLALAFSLQDFAGFLWTLLTWRSSATPGKAAG